jgi:O-antigen ligase
LRFLLPTVLLISFILGNFEVIDRVYLPHLLLVFLLFLLAFGNYNRFRISFRIIILFSLFLLSTLVSTLMASSIGALIASTQLILFVFAILVPILYVKNLRRFKTLTFVVFFGALANALVGIIQSVDWISKYGFVLIAEGSWFRVQGLTVSPADYVMQLVVGLVFSEIVGNVKLRKLSVGIFITCLIFSNSRTALIVIVLYILRSLVVSKRGAVVFSILSFTFTYFFIFYTMPGELVLNRFLDIVNPDYNIKRLVTFEFVIQSIISGPLELLIGHGYGTFEFFNPIENENYNNTHNMYLHLFYSGGLFGFLTFYTFLFYVYIKARTFKNRSLFFQDFTRLSRGMLFFMWIVLIGGMVETNLVGINSGYITGLAFGIVVAGENLLRNNEFLKFNV